jgi:hypothetical protein
MKAIVCDIIISSVSTSSDKSLRFRASTPELSDTEAVAFMGLRGINIRALLEPSDYAVEGKLEVKATKETPTQSSRIRGALYVWHKTEIEMNRLPKDDSFERFYQEYTEKILIWIKKHLPERD